MNRCAFFLLQFFLLSRSFVLVNCVTCWYEQAFFFGKSLSHMFRLSIICLIRYTYKALFEVVMLCYCEYGPITLINDLNLIASFQLLI